MATRSNSSGAGKDPILDDPATTFRGDIQPPVNDLLEAANIFLADKDIDRKLHFEERLGDNDGYIKHIKKHDLNCDPFLLHGVKTKATVHHEWQESRARGLPSGCVCPTGTVTYPTISTRLVDAETAVAVEERRKLVGLDQQVRDDHAPLTAIREKDNAEFREAMLDHATQDPELVDPEKNLIFVESRAYEEALKDPAMIPYWMHPEEGLPTTDQNEFEDPHTPWFRSHELTDVEKNRPLRPPLSDYLQAREREINKLLKLIPITDGDFMKLEKLLRLHEPANVKKLFKLWQELRVSNSYERASMIVAAEKAYFAAREDWLDAFRLDGVYLMEKREGPQSTQPGVFYLPGPETISNDCHARARQDQAKLNSLLARVRQAGGLLSLGNNDNAYRTRLELAEVLLPFVPGRLQQQSLDFFTKTEVANELTAEWIEWVDVLSDVDPQIVILRPGEMASEDPSLLCVEWESEGQTDSQLPTPISPSTLHADRSWEFQALLQKKRDPRFTLSEQEVDRLTDLIVIFHPKIIMSADVADELLGPRENHNVNGEAVIVMTDSAADEKEEAELLKADILVREHRKRILPLRKEVAATAAKTLSCKTAATEALREAKGEFLESWWEWYCQLRPNAAALLRNKIVANYPGKIDFTGKAERRGVQRAAVQLALNLLATNQEQHRPNDRFRIVELPPAYKPPPEEVPLALPLQPWKRPEERDPFEYTKKVATYQQAKDFEYCVGRDRTTQEHPGELRAPANYNGPFVVADGVDFKETARARQKLLQSYYSLLALAQRESPRPLLQRMLHKINCALSSNPEVPETGEFCRLSQRDLDLLEEIGGEPWDERAQLYDLSTVFKGDHREEKAFLEFEKEVKSKEIFEAIPLWHPSVEEESEVPIELRYLCSPVGYDPKTRSVTGLGVGDLVQRIRSWRLDRYKSLPFVHLWTREEALRYLGFMATFLHIHFDKDEGEEPRVSRIPLSGYPENKYITSVEGAESSIGVFRIGDGKLKVRYDSAGFVGPPILQPNKYEHFLDLSDRLGRETRECLQIQRRDVRSWSTIDGVAEQMEALSDALNEMAKFTQDDHEDSRLHSIPEVTASLEQLALELNEYAPDLAQGAGFDWSKNSAKSFLERGTERQQNKWNEQRQSEYAAVIQMKILEEANTNWESRFPENEHVWDFALERVAPITRDLHGRQVEVIPTQKQFFSMQRWPVNCLSETTQILIQKSGPSVPTKLKPPAKDKESHRLSGKDVGPKKKGERHIKGREPYFPFGETPYQSAFLSFQMEEDLKDVPEFQTKKPSWYSRLIQRKRKPRTEPFSLPKLPKGWTPDNVSLAEKHSALLNYAKNTPGFPDSDVLEYYHTQEEIEWIRQYTVARETGRQVAEASSEEIREARERLNTDAGRGARERVSRRSRRYVPPPLGLSEDGLTGSKRAARSDAVDQRSVKRTRFAAGL